MVKKAIVQQNACVIQSMAAKLNTKKIALNTEAKKLESHDTPTKKLPY